MRGGSVVTWLGVVGFGLAGLVSACGPADIFGTPLEGTRSTNTGTEPSASHEDPACHGPSKLEAMDPSTLPPCCDGSAHCVPTAKVPGNVRRSLGTCEGGYCVPDSLLLSAGAPPPACTAFNGEPGACLSTCVPEVGKNASVLQVGTCQAGERCAPCLHPITKANTGSCDIGKASHRPTNCSADGGDDRSEPGSNGGGADGPCPHVGPPVIDPTKLPPCGDVPGAHCLDVNLVAAELRSKLAACATGLCVPDTFLTSGGKFIPLTCASLGGIEGRCLHRVLPDVKKQADVLPVSTCGTGELCAPCWHPSDGTDTGACTRSCDPGPKSPPPACPHQGPDVFDPAKWPACGTAAHCMPAALVSAPMAADLAPCAGGVCVPDVFIRSGGRYVPPTCTGIGGAEGRCLHRVIPKIAAQSNLPTSTCAAYERCAPCYNPLDGKDTGACRRSCDPGPKLPAYTFPSCCALGGQYRGKCVPATAVPDEQEANLSRDVCAKASDVCVPTENLAESFAPPACSAFSLAYFGSYAGVCLSNCLSFSGLEGLAIKQGTCDAVHQCVPCTTPLGKPTGAPGCY